MSIASYPSGPSQTPDRTGPVQVHPRQSKAAYPSWEREDAAREFRRAIAIMWKKKVQILWEFAVHVVVGTSLFVLIYAPVVGLNVLVRWLKKGHVAWEVDPVVIGLLIIGEAALALADTILFLYFLYVTTRGTLKELS